MCAEEHHFLGSHVEFVSFLSNIPQTLAPSRRRLVWPSAQSSLSCGISGVYYPLPCSTEFHFTEYCSLHAHGPAQSRILLCHLTTTPRLSQRTKREKALEPHAFCCTQKPHSIQHQPMVHGPAVWATPPPLSLIPKELLNLPCSQTSGSPALLASGQAQTCLQPTENTAFEIGPS